MKFKTIEQDIKPILQKYKGARADDMILYIKYLSGKKVDAGKAFIDRKYRLSFGIASYESVSRIRRKLQERYADLRPSKEYMEKRKEAEKKYRDYAKGVKE